MRSWLVTAAIVGSLVLAACGDSQDTSPSGTDDVVASATEEESAAGSPAVEAVESGEFYLEYDRNPEGTEAKYIGKLIEVSGTVSAFGTNDEDIAYINLLVSRIQCIFAEPGPQAAFTGLSLGLTKTVRGIVEFRTETVRKETGRFALFAPPGKVLTLVGCEVVE